MQPPPRGCVLKPRIATTVSINKSQPPPRGCVLKHLFNHHLPPFVKAAASARLCVETKSWRFNYARPLAAASARLCVETLIVFQQE